MRERLDFHKNQQRRIRRQPKQRRLFIFQEQRDRLTDVGDCVIDRRALRHDWDIHTLCNVQSLARPNSDFDGPLHRSYSSPAHTAAAIFSAFFLASSSVPTYMNALSGRSSPSPSQMRRKLSIVSLSGV